MRAEDYYHYSYFHTPAPWAEKSLLVSDGMAYTADPDFLIDRRTFYNYLAVYVHRGTFYLQQYGHSHVLHEGDVGIMSLMDAHRYFSDHEDVAHLLWFHFRGGGTDNIIDMLKQNNALPCLYHFPEAEADFFENFRLTKAGCSETKLAGHMYGLLMEILEHAPVRFCSDSNIPDELRQAADFMTAHPGKNLTLDQISARANMGKYHFCHMFKRWYGISPMQYYNGRKMEQACTLLLKSSMSIDRIAEQLGYLNTDYFRRAFKNYFGITPSAYRHLQIPNVGTDALNL